MCYSWPRTGLPVLFVLLSLYLSLCFFESLEAECSGFGIQLDVQALTWMIESFHLSAMPLGSSLTVVFRVGSVLCITDTAVGLWSLLEILNVAPTQALSVPAVRHR